MDVGATRFPFLVERNDDDVLVAMACGGIMRSREMSTTMLSIMVEACQQVKADIIDVLAAQDDFVEHVPHFPHCISVGGAGDIAGVCSLKVTASQSDGHIELATAFYDSGDDSCPTLLLIDEQLNEFIERASTLLA